MVLLALLVPANAAAHGRGPIVALDDRLKIDRPAAGIAVRVLDGDRSLRVSVEPGRSVVVRGYLDEPMIRFAGGAVEANRASPTASADRIVSAGSGWQRVATGRSFAWHDHRLAPPAGSPVGSAGRWSVPVTIDGRRAAITGTFVRVRRPSILPWLLGAAGVAAAVAALAARRPQSRATLVLVLAVVAGSAALLAIAAFSVRDAPTGGIEWFQLGGGAVVAAAGATILARTSGSRRTAAAGVIGALAAAAMLSSLPVFRHGVVISALPAALARLACAAAVVGGVCAAALSLVADRSPRVVR
ncbi:MAG TPA: hypothetical protein VH538_07760 [Gaiellaceae bacterium]